MRFRQNMAMQVTLQNKHKHKIVVIREVSTETVHSDGADVFPFLVVWLETGFPSFAGWSASPLLCWIWHRDKTIRSFLKRGVRDTFAFDRRLRRDFGTERNR